MNLKYLQQNKSISVIDKKGIDKFQQSPCRVCNIVFPRTKPTLKHHIANPHSQKWLTPSLASGLPTLQFGQRGLTRNLPLSESIVGRQPQPLTSSLAQWRVRLVGKCYETVN